MFFSGFSVRHLDRFDAPAEKSIALTEEHTVFTSHVSMLNGERQYVSMLSGQRQYVSRLSGQR